MVKKNILIIIVMIASLLLGACGGDGKEDLFKQQQERELAANLKEAAGSTASNPFELEDIITTTPQQTSRDTAANTTVAAENLAAGTTELPKGSVNESTLANSHEANQARVTSGLCESTETTDTQEAYNDAEMIASEGKALAAGQKELQLFYYTEITQEIKNRINGKSYGENCDVPYEELRYVQVLHIGFDGETHTGELIVNKAIAEDILEIFRELYELRYPIERMVLVDEYEADDNTSMEANNTSAFNFRLVEGTNRRSLHSDGIAIDINPRYNPYIHKVDGETVVTPVNGVEYADRTLDCEYYIHKDDPCYKAFISRGFSWGGEWKNSKDYQHFQKIIE